MRPARERRAHRQCRQLKQKPEPKQHHQQQQPRRIEIQSADCAESAESGAPRSASFGSVPASVVSSCCCDGAEKKRTSTAGTERRAAAIGRSESNECIGYSWPERDGAAVSWLRLRSILMQLSDDEKEVRPHTHTHQHSRIHSHSDAVARKTRIFSKNKMKWRHGEQMMRNLYSRFVYPPIETISRCSDKLCWLNKSVEMAHFARSIISAINFRILRARRTKNGSTASRVMPSVWLPNESASLPRKHARIGDDDRMH